MIMEEELLQEMIRDRESQLEMIRKKMDQQTKKFEAIQKQLEETKQKYVAGNMERQLEVETLTLRHSKIVSQYKEAKDGLDMKKQQQGAQLHVYNEIMKSLATPEDAQDSSYVTRMQAQLCKGMHSMGMVETQLAMLTTQLEAMEKTLKDEKTAMIDEKTQVELKLMNDLVATDNVRREVESKVKEQAESFTTEKDALIERIEQQQEEPPEDDDDEEKEELMEILEEGREEISRMEQENKEELKKLEELKNKVIEAKGVEFVEELVAQIAEEFSERQEDSDEE